MNNFVSQEKFKSLPKKFAKIYFKSLNLKDMNNSVNIKCENLKFQNNLNNYFLKNYKL